MKLRQHHKRHINKEFNGYDTKRLSNFCYWNICDILYAVEYVSQIRKSLRTKKTDDVSKWLIISLIAGLSLWVVYGVMKGDIIIIGANSIGVSLNVFLLILKLKYS